MGAMAAAMGRSYGGKMAVRRGGGDGTVAGGNKCITYILAPPFSATPTIIALTSSIPLPSSVAGGLSRPVNLWP